MLRLLRALWWGDSIRTPAPFVSKPGPQEALDWPQFASGLRIYNGNEEVTVTDCGLYGNDSFTILRDGPAQPGDLVYDGDFDPVPSGSRM